MQKNVVSNSRLTEIRIETTTFTFLYLNSVRMSFVCESRSTRTRNDRLAHEPVLSSDMSGVESRVERKRPAILPISRGILVLYACVVKCLVRIQVFAVFCAWCHGQATSSSHYRAPVDLARTDSFHFPSAIRRHRPCSHS